MSILQIEVADIRPVSVGFAEGRLVVSLADGRSVSAPIGWFPRLAAATEAERSEVELMPMGVHFPRIDEDVSVASLLRGRAETR